MKRTLFSIVMVVLVLSTVLGSLPVLAEDAVVAGDDVRPAEARAAAEYFAQSYVSAFPAWKEAAVGTPTDYYWPDGGISAFEFPIEDKTGVVGFLFISATKDYGPLFEASGGKAPSAYLDSARILAAANGFIGQDFSGETRFLYYGALTYSVQFGEAMIAKGVAIHLPTGAVEQVSTEATVLQMDRQAADASWAAVSALAPKGGYSVRSITWIYGVPAWYQDSYSGGHGDSGDDSNASWPSCAGTANDPWDYWDGCSPIAGAMVLGYWDTHGYPMGSSAYDDLLIDHAHYFMGTTDGGVTEPWNIDYGLWATAYIYGYDFDAYNDNWVSWGDITGEVSAGYPSVLSMLGQTYYGNHSVTVVGYEYHSPYQDVWVNNTWDTSQHLIAFGSWSWATLTRVHPN